MAWIQQHAITIRTCDPAATDDADLAPLRDRLDGVRLLLLGEPSHGDGTAFLLKHRLMRFLHRELGFDVLAWQSGIYDCAVMEDLLHTDQPVAKAATAGLYAMWNGSAEARPVLDYVRSTHATDRPIAMAGFECNPSGSGSEQFASRMLAAFDAAGPALLTGDERNTFVAAHRRLYQPPFFSVGSQVARDQDAMSTLIARLEAADSPLREHYDAHQRGQLIRELASFRTLLQLRLLGQRPDARAEEHNLQQRGMADNLEWLTRERFAGRRIVAWIGNQYLLRAIDQLDTGPQRYFTGYVTLGDLLASRFDPAEVRTVAVTAYQGRAGLPIHKPEVIAPAPAGSIEALCHATGASCLWLDLPAHDDAAWLDQPLLARPYGYLPMTAHWPRHVDAFLYIDDMAPSTIIAR